MIDFCLVPFIALIVLKDLVGFNLFPYILKYERKIIIHDALWLSCE